MISALSKLHLRGLARYSTDELMLLVQRGDALAFEVFYYRMSPIVRRFITSHRSTKISVEDAVQEVFCRVWAQQGRFLPGKASAQTYLLAICLNVAREFRRNVIPVRQLVEDTSENYLEPRDTSEGFEREELGITLREARCVLSNNQSMAISLVYDDGLKPRDAAHRLGCTEKALRRRLEEARRKLFRYMQPLYSALSNRCFHSTQAGKEG